MHFLGGNEETEFLMARRQERNVVINWKKLRQRTWWQERQTAWPCVLTNCIAFGTWEPPCSPIYPWSTTPLVKVPGHDDRPEMLASGAMWGSWSEIFSGEIHYCFTLTFSTSKHPKWIDPKYVFSTTEIGELICGTIEPRKKKRAVDIPLYCFFLLGCNCLLSLFKLGSISTHIPSTTRWNKWSRKRDRDGVTSSLWLKLVIYIYFIPWPQGWSNFPPRKKDNCLESRF